MESPRPPSLTAGSVRVATWNIHGGVGRDGKYDVARIVAVVQELQADVVALQEVSFMDSDDGCLKGMTSLLGYTVVAGRTDRRHGAAYGNALLSRFPLESWTLIDLTVPPHEQRGAIDAAIRINDNRVRVICTHLGLRPYERRQQVQRILAFMQGERADSVVLMGDVNEWLLWGRPLRWLHRAFRRQKTPATFPAGYPIFALDRIWTQPRGTLSRLIAHRSALASVASDHLPLVAELQLG